MTLMARLDALLSDPDVRPKDRRPQVFALLRQQPAGGAAAAADCLLRTGNAQLASYLAQYISRLPGERETKIAVVERLRTEPYLCGEASHLVRWMTPELLDGFLQDYLALPAPSTLGLREPWGRLASVVSDIAMHQPERVRPFADRITDKYTRELLITGAPDAEVDALVARWLAEGDVEHLETVARARTDHARRQLLAQRAHFTTEPEDPDDPDDPDLPRSPQTWERLVQQAGLLPDTRRAAGYRPAHHGYVAAGAESPHRLGGAASGDVPLCGVCGTPSAPLLTLSAAALPAYELSGRSGLPLVHLRVPGLVFPHRPRHRREPHRVRTRDGTGGTGRPDTARGAVPGAGTQGRAL